MKKQFIILLTAALLLNLSSCSTQQNAPDNKAQDEQTTNENTSEDNVQSSDSNDSNTQGKTSAVDNNTAASKNNASSTESNKSNNTSNSNSKKTSNNNNSKQASENESNTNSSNTSSEKQSFYGEWEIKDVLAYGKVSGGPDKSEVTGKKITLLNNSASFENNSYSYSVTTESKDQLETDYRIGLSKLGIDKNSVTCINVHLANSLDMAFLVKDDNSLVYCTEGVFYEVKRIK